ncbi:Dirigent protein 19 [Linum grandiflorum]
MVAMNLVFLQGKYNGSTVTLMGRNRTGVFRFASGFATASTFRFNQTSGDAVAEYDLYVLHY